MTTKSKEAPKRLKPLPETLRELFLLSGNECAMPGCKTVLIDESGTMIGEVAHIAAAKPDGARFDKNMTNEERRAAQNLLLLCASHHSQVDGKDSGFTTRQLIAIKESHEKRFRAVERSILKRFETQFPDSTDEINPTKPETLSGFRTVFQNSLSDGDAEIVSKQLGEFSERLGRVPLKHRDFMCQVIKRCASLGKWQDDVASLTCNDVAEALQISHYKLKNIISGLDEYNVGSLGENMNNQPTVDLHSPSDYVGWGSIYDYCQERGIELERFVIDVQFGLLD